MIRAEQIPPEAYAAAAELLAEGARTDQAIAAAINAWPGAFQTTTQINRDATEVLIFPLPTEKLE